MAQSNTRIQLEAWLKTIDVVGSVLDIGGAQHNIKGRTKSWDVDDYKVLDLEQPHQGAKSDIVADMNYEIDEWGHYFQNAFMIEVSEYLFNPLQAFKNVHWMLEINGLFYVSTHLFYPTHLPEGMDYLRYTPFGIVKLLEEAGFEILENIPRVAKVNFAEAWSIEGMRGWKDFDTSIIGNLIKCRKK